tara:strand:- start:1011 stop:1202 length:192 start_codon:yes stop_codon:yes gene_type:complete
VDINQQIAEILMEADSYYVRRDVIALAKEFRMINPAMSLVDSFKSALDAELALAEVKDKLNEQ